jgi:hypothetical protein
VETAGTHVRGADARCLCRTAPDRVTGASSTSEQACLNGCYPWTSRRPCTHGSRQDRKRRAKEHSNGPGSKRPGGVRLFS